jgi:hypothetical protein
MSLVTRTLMALQIEHRDLTNRVNYDAVWTRCLRACKHYNGVSHIDKAAVRAGTCAQCSRTFLLGMRPDSLLR